jgi:DNA-binding winged helix-turn-helix (wHTH) protein
MPPANETTYRFEGFALDLRRGCLRGQSGEVDLRPKSFEVLRYLVENAGRLVPKDELIKAVWPDVIVSDESLARCVSDVRQALGDRAQRIVRTVPRRGYLFAVSLSGPEIADPLAAGSGPGGERRGQTLLAERPAERRQLTVLAGELTGLADLATRLDPEDFQIALADCRRHCAEVMARHHGHVASFSEEGILVWFGYPRAREHDAEHAVRAGLALLASPPDSAWNSAWALNVRPGGPLRPRVGIASGVVVIASGQASGEAWGPAAAGQPPHIARQLRNAAAPGDLVIDPATRRLVGGLFEYEPFGPPTRDDGAAQTWLVRSEKGDTNRFAARSDIPADGTEAGLSPFVGRAHELDVLLGCLVSRADHVAVIDVVGEPGIGKSRLLHEFRRLAQAEVRIWSGSCWPGDEQVPFRPFIEVIRRAFHIDTRDEAPEIANKLDTGLAILGLATRENLGLLLNLLGLEPPAGAMRGLDDVLVGLRTRDLLLKLAQEGSRTKPVVLLLEDLHWIDGASQDLLDRIAAMPNAGSLAIFHTRRPAYVPPWNARANTTTLRLEPLAASETARIVEARLGVPALTGALGRLIIDRAEGNPLFAEEIANFLRERGMVRQSNGGLEYDTAAVAAAVPASVQSLLTQRADRLTPDDRALLQAAAVIGRRFSAGLLAAVTTGADVAARLAVMEQHDLVRRAPGSGEFTFKHALGRDALYASLLSGPRQALHLAIAREIEARNAGRLGEVADVLAHHYARADHKQKAVEYLALVGRRSLGIYSLDEAEYSLRTALGIARSEDAERMDHEIATILVDLTVVYYLQFRSAETVALIEPELARLDRLGDNPQVPILLDLYGVGLFTSCRFHEAKRMADQALAIAERLGDGRALAHARAGVIMMSIYIDPTPLAEFEAFARRTHEEAERDAPGYIVTRITMVTATNYLHRGLTLEGSRWARRLMQFGREHDDRRATGMALWLLGWFATVADDPVAALAYAEECIATALAPYDQQQGQLIAGIARLLGGRVEEGVTTLERRQAYAIANGWHYAALAAEAPLGVAMLLRGDLRKGVRTLEALIERVESVLGYRGYADWSRIFLAEFYIALLRGERKPSLRVILKNLPFLLLAKRRAAKRALDLLGRAMENPQFSEDGVFRARIDFNLGLLHKMMGRNDVAQTYLRHGRDVAHAQEAAALVMKIDAAMEGLREED